MADQEGGEISVIDAEMMNSYGLEVKRGRHSSKFVEGLLEGIRDRNDTGRKKKSLENDDDVSKYAQNLISKTYMPKFMTDFFSESINDGIENKVKAPEFKKLRELRDTAASVAAGMRVGSDELLEINEYIDTQYEYWRNRGEHDEGEEQQLSRENQGIFKAFQLVLENPRPLEDIPNGPEESGAGAGAEIEARKGQPDLPAFKYEPTTFLENQDVEDMNLDTVYEYLSDARKKLYSQERALNKNEPELVTVVSSAWDYVDKHMDSTEDIVVVVDDKQVVYCGEAQNAPQKRDGKMTYVLKGDRNPDTPNGIVTNAKRLYEYETRIDNVDRGIATVRKLLDSDDAMIADSHDGSEDLLAITRLLDLHREALLDVNIEVLDAQGLAEADRQWKLLAGLSKAVEARTPVGRRGVFTPYYTAAAEYAKSLEVPLSEDDPTSEEIPISEEVPVLS